MIGKRAQRVFLFILFSSLFVIMIVSNTNPRLVPAQEFYGMITYTNYVNGLNLTISTIYINITIYQNAPRSLWLIVPKDWKGSIITSNQLPVNIKLYPLYSDNEENPFYANLTISYSNYNTFSLLLSYSHPHTLLIVEPNAVYFSPLIGHSSWLNRRFIVEIENVSIKEVKSASPRPSDLKIIKNGLEAVFGNGAYSRVNLFLVTSGGSFVEVSKGNLTIKTPKRYYNIANDLLEQVSRIYYNNMIKLFNVTLRNVLITFYIPERLDDFSVGGYVPYSGGEVGNIYINLIYYRGIDGELLLITLHELVHRFLFKLGLDPNKVLWVHEGLAEYVSTSLINVPASIERKNLLESIAKNLTNYGFIENWKPGEPVNNILSYYAASYFVFKKLGEMYYGLDGYTKFFRLLLKEQVFNTRDVVKVLNKAWNTNLTSIFITWGFASLQSTQFNSAMLEAEKYIENATSITVSLPWWLQPIKWISEFFINMAKDSLDSNKIFLATIYAAIALLISLYALLIQFIAILLLIAATIIIVIDKISKRKRLMFGTTIS